MKGTMHLKKTFGGMEIELEFSLKELESDMMQGGSPRFNWWLEEQSNTIDTLDLLLKFRWNEDRKAQSQQTLLEIASYIALNKHNHHSENFPPDWGGLNHNQRSMFDKIVRLLKGGEFFGYDELDYRTLNLLKINFIALNMIAEVQSSNGPNHRVISLVSEYAELARKKNHDDSDFGIVDLYLRSTSIQCLMAQLNYIISPTAKGRKEFLWCLEEIFHFSEKDLVPYPQSKADLEVMSSLIMDPPDAVNFPFLKQMNPKVWHHVISALRRNIL